jgi:hypothetical protein
MNSSSADFLSAESALFPILHIRLYLSNDLKKRINEVKETTEILFLTAAAGY